MLSKIVKLFVSLVIVFLAGFIGQIFTTPAIPAWYATLNKPGFTPPNWVFAPVWTLLYLMMAVAFYLIWIKDSKNQGIKLFLGQLALNSLWSILFFGLRSPALGFACIILLWLAILYTIIEFNKTSKIAAYLLIPYLLWVTYASALNLAVSVLN